jgi:hypothetical protein
MPENRTETTPGQFLSDTFRLSVVLFGPRRNWPGFVLPSAEHFSDQNPEQSYSHNNSYIRLSNQCLPALTPISHRSEDGQTYMYAAVSVQDSAHFPAQKEAR